MTSAMGLAPDRAETRHAARVRSTAGPVTREARQAPETPVHTTLTAAANVDLSAIMRAERISNITYDRLLDRFTVTLLDYSIGGGGSVGEALAQAKRRAA